MTPVLLGLPLTLCSPSPYLLLVVSHGVLWLLLYRLLSRPPSLQCLWRMSSHRTPNQGILSIFDSLHPLPSSLVHHSPRERFRVSTVIHTRNFFERHLSEV